MISFAIHWLKCVTVSLIVGGIAANVFTYVIVRGFFWTKGI